MRDYGHGPDDRTGDKLMRSLPQRQNRGRPVHLPLFAAIANDPFITPTPSQLPQKCSPQCRKFPLDTNAPDKWVCLRLACSSFSSVSTTGSCAVTKRSGSNGSVISMILP